MMDFEKELGRFAKTNPEFALRIMATELKNEILETERIEEETSALPAETLLGLGFDKERLKVLEKAENDLKQINERANKALKELGV